MQDDSVKFDELKRVVVIGSSCSGKTTLAAKLAEILKVKHIEMDAVNWLPNWEQRTTKELRKLIEKETDSKKWVLDGNYSRTRDITWNRATHIIWLDYSFPTVIYRAIKRTIKRAYTKEKICGGNHETFEQSFFSTNSMILWAIKTHYSRCRRYKKQIEDNEDFNLQFIIFNNSKQADKFLHRLK